VTASYAREDFIKVHKNVMSAMKKHGVEHQYLDGLDDASGVKKEAEAVKCDKCGLPNCQDEKCKGKDDKPKCQDGQKRVKLSFDFYIGQPVVSLARNRMRDVGTLRDIDGLVGKVEWAEGLETTEMLAALIPHI
jgi:hypothetical protein